MFVMVSGDDGDYKHEVDYGKLFDKNPHLPPYRSMSSNALLSPAVFDEVRAYTSQGVECWRARKLQSLLGYEDWDNLTKVIDKAMRACEGAGQKADVHFRETTEVKVKSNGAKTARKDYWLTRHACYLVAMNADGTKQEVADAMTYFSIQTQRQELADQRAKDAKRVEWRGYLTDRQNRLHSAAKLAGVENYALFNDAGHKGLYGGRHLSAILNYKKLPPKSALFDHIGTTELAAHAFRATQAAEVIQRERIRGQEACSKTHEKVGAEVRQTIKTLGNTMPEDLPTEPDIKIIKRRLAKAPKNTKPPCQPLRLQE
jgi:DNA-damage-inducible protein D